MQSSAVIVCMHVEKSCTHAYAVRTCIKRYVHSDELFCFLCCMCVYSYTSLCVIDLHIFLYLVKCVHLCVCVCVS